MIHVLIIRTALTLLPTLVLAAGASAGGQSETERLDAIAKQAEARFTAAMTAAHQLPAPKETLSVLAASPVVIELSLEDAVKAALDKNLDIAVERLNPQTFDLSLAALRATYRPTVSTTIGQNSVTQLPTSQLIGGARVKNDIGTYNGGVLQNMPWGGGNLNVGWNNRRQESTSSFNTFNPQYNSTFSAVFTQPLLRGFSIDSTRSQLVVTRLNRDISDVQLRAVITNTLANVRSAYWDLVFAMQAVEVANKSLELAEKLIEDNKARVEVGTMAPIDVVQSEAEAASRRQTLTQAEATWRTAELALKRLIVGGTEDQLWPATLNPIDRPSFRPETVNVAAAVRKALDQRTDLVQSRKQLEANDVNLSLLRNQLLPAADLVTTYGLQGIGGTRTIRGGLGSQEILQNVPGGYGDALTALSHRDYPNWNLQINISYPIGSNAAEANLARARVQKNQSLAQIRALELQVATEVTNTALQVQANLKRVEAATAARELSQKRLEAEQSKFEVGISTNFFVVQAQRDLADAQNVELRALLDYRKALVDFERVQETSLARAGITVISGSGVGGSTTGSGRTSGSGTTGGTGVGTGGTGGGGTSGGGGL